MSASDAAAPSAARRSLWREAVRRLACRWASSTSGRRRDSALRAPGVVRPKDGGPTAGVAETEAPPRGLRGTCTEPAAVGPAPPRSPHHAPGPTPARVGEKAADGSTTFGSPPGADDRPRSFARGATPDEEGAARAPAPPTPARAVETTAGGSSAIGGPSVGDDVPRSFASWAPPGDQGIARASAPLRQAFHASPKSVSGGELATGAASADGTPDVHGAARAPVPSPQGPSSGGHRKKKKKKKKKRKSERTPHEVSAHVIRANNGPRILGFMSAPPLFASRLLSWTLYVRACWNGSFVELRLASRVPVSSSVSSWLARGVESPVARRGCSLLSRACRLGSRCAVRLFRWMGVWGVLVGLIEFSGFLVRPAARPPAPSTTPVHRPRPPPLSTAPSPPRPPRRRHDPTRPENRGWCPGEFPYVPYDTHSKPRSF